MKENECLIFRENAFIFSFSVKSTFLRNNGVMLLPDGVTGDTRYFKRDDIKNKSCSFLAKTQTICVSPVRNKENEFHRQDPIGN